MTVPTPLAVTKPLLLTVATAVLRLCHVRLPAEIVFPAASRAVTPNCIVLPTPVRATEAGETRSVPGGGSGSGAGADTRVGTTAVMPLADTVIVACPAPAAVATPALLTRTTDVFDDAQDTETPEITLPISLSASAERVAD